MAATNAALRSAPGPDRPAGTLLSDIQRRAIFAMFGAGLGFLLVGLLVPPAGVAFWLAFALLPPAAGLAAAALGGERGRGIDAWLLRGGAPGQAWQPVAAAALPEATRLALQVAAVPALLAELARASAGMQGPEKAAAGRLLDAAVAAWNAAPDLAMRGALARDLPRLVAGLAAGGPAAIRAAEDAADRLSASSDGRS